MRRTITFLGLLISLALFLTACVGAREISELGISLIIGLDKEGDKILLTAEVVDPLYTGLDGDEGGQGNPVKYVQGIGNTVFEAFRDVVLKFDRRLFTSHNKVLIFGEEIAEMNLARHIDELFRDREQRESANILIVKGGKAYEVMGINNGLTKIPALYISNLIDNTKNNPKALNVNMVDFLKHYYHKGHQPVAGVIEKIKKRKIDIASEEDDSGNYELSILGSAVFNEGSLVGYLNGNDTKALNFIMDDIKNGIITFPMMSFVINEDINSHIDHRDLGSIVIIRSKTKNDIEIRNDDIILKTQIKIRGSLGEVITNMDIKDMENLKKIEDACSRVMEARIKEAVKKVQRDFALDLFGFGLVFHRKYPKEWKRIKHNWDEIFSKANYEIEVTTDIIRTGLINDPVIDEKGK